MKMKKTILLSVLFFAVISFSSIAQNIKNEGLIVYGNCKVCKNRIETAAKTLDGIATAEWNNETKILDVSYDKSKTKIRKISKVIAKAGHDTDMHKASNEAYNALHGCCQYDRAVSIEKSTHGGHEHNH